jgi:hypothetical protein
VAQKIPLSAVVEIDRNPAKKKKTEKAVDRGRSPTSVRILTGTTGDFDRSSNAMNEGVCA